MTAYLTFELRRLGRDRRLIGLVVAWPVAAYLLFSAVFSAPSDRAEGLPPATEIMVAMAAFGAIGAVLLSSGPRLAAEREAGWLRQLGLTPLSTPALLATRLVVAMVGATPAIALTFLVGALGKGVDLAPARLAEMAALILLGSVPVVLLGMAIGTLTGGEAATGVSMAAYVTLGALGGLWMPVRILPPALRAIAHGLPSNQMAVLAWRTAAGAAPPAEAWLVLGAWTAGAIALCALIRRRLADTTA